MIYVIYLVFSIDYEGSPGCMDLDVLAFRYRN